MRRLVYTIMLICLPSLSAAQQIISTISRSHESAKIDGRASMRGLYSWDDGPVSKDVFIGFLDTDLEAKQLTSLQTGLVLDATFMGDFTQANERRFGETETSYRIRQLYVIHPSIKGRADIIIGRRLISQAGNAWVDGLDLRFRLGKGIHLGAYGGLRPDVIDFAITPDYQAAGTYFEYQRKGLDLELAYNAVLRDGLDRQFAYGRFHWKMAEALYVSTYAVADFQQNADVTTLISTVDYSPKRALNLTLTFSRYSLEQYRNATIYQNVVEPNQALILGDEIIDLVYNRARFTTSIRFWRRFYHYQSVEYKVRSQDDRDAWLYTIGIRDDDFMSWGTRLDLRTTFNNHFRSDSWLFALDAEHDLTRSLSGNLRMTYFDGRTTDRFTERGRTFDEAQSIFLAGCGFYWRPSGHHLMSLDYDGIYESNLQDERTDVALFIHTLMTRYSYYF